MADDCWNFAEQRAPLTIAEEVRALAAEHGCPTGTKPLDWIRKLLTEGHEAARFRHYEDLDE